MSAWRKSVLTAMLSSVAVSAAATDPARTCHASSGSERLPVLELYTSEGCSSCPPADQWLTRTFEPGATGSKRVVPLAFHVDYWNALGWPDRFSKPAFTARQQAVAARAHASAIYTPQFVFDGRDVRPHTFARDILERAETAATNAARARIDVETGVVAGKRIRVVASVRTDASAGAPPAQVWVALFQNDLRSRVNAGENAGRWLRHDFVVREWSGPFAASAPGPSVVQSEWAWPTEFRDRSAGIAVVVEDSRTGATLQALAMPLCQE